MLDTHYVLFLIILVLSFSGACLGLPQGEYAIDKTSPNGLFRVIIAVTPRGKNKPVDKAKFQFFEGNELIETWDWAQQDPWEPNFDSFKPIEWIDNNILRMGNGSPDEKFLDELTLFNATDETLKYVSINYGRFESFRVFSLSSGSHVTLRPAPWFTVTGGEFWISYRGMTKSGRQFGEMLKSGERTSPDDGPRRFNITIKPEHLR